MLKPEVLHDDAVKAVRALYEAATVNMEVLYESIKLFGGAAIKVNLVLFLQDGWISAPEITRCCGLPQRSVYRGLAQLAEVEMVEQDGPMYRLAAAHRRKTGF